MTSSVAITLVGLGIRPYELTTIEAISPSQQDLRKAMQARIRTNAAPSIFIDGSIEAAWGDTTKAVNTDW